MIESRLSDLWTPLRRGLVVDPEGKHIRRLRRAVWLLEYCFLHADWQTGVLVRKQSRIAQDMGMSPRTIRDWMHRLVAKGYVTVRRSGRASVIRVLRWRPLRRRSASLSGRSLPVRAAGTGQRRVPEARIGKESRGEIDCAAPPYKSLLTKYLYQDGDRSPPDTDDDARIALVANDLATGLDDPEGLSEYRALAHRYPEPLLRELLSRVRSVPRSEIRKSRKALFVSLLSHHADATA